MSEYMTHVEYCTLYAQALIELEDYGSLNYDTKTKLSQIQSGAITVLDVGEVRPLETIEKKD